MWLNWFVNPATPIRLQPIFYSFQSLKVASLWFGFRLSQIMRHSTDWVDDFQDLVDGKCIIPWMRCFERVSQRKWLRIWKSNFCFVSKHSRFHHGIYMDDNFFACFLSAFHWMLSQSHDRDQRLQALNQKKVQRRVFEIWRSRLLIGWWNTGWFESNSLF